MWMQRAQRLRQQTTCASRSGESSWRSPLNGLRSCAVHAWLALQVRQYPGRRPHHQHFERHARGRGTLPSFKDVGRSPLQERCCSEHPFSTVHTQQMLSIARESDWLRSETLVTKIIQQWSGVTQSKKKEHCVREQRQSEINRVGPPLLAQPDQREDRTSRRESRLLKISLRFAPLRITTNTAQVEGQEHRRAICGTPAEGPTGVQRDCVDDHADPARAGCCSVRGVESVEAWQSSWPRG